MGYTTRSSVRRTNVSREKNSLLRRKVVKKSVEPSYKNKKKEKAIIRVIKKVSKVVNPRTLTNGLESNKKEKKLIRKASVVKKKVTRKAVPKEKRMLKKCSIDEVADLLRVKEDIFTVRDITDEFVQTFTGNTTSYDKNKGRDIGLFFHIFGNNSHLGFLADPGRNGQEYLYKLTAFKNTESSKYIINKALCIWANTVVKDKYCDQKPDKMTEKIPYGSV